MKIQEFTDKCKFFFNHNMIEISKESRLIEGFFWGVGDGLVSFVAMTLGLEWRD
jgi:hypothetical protein